MKKLGIRLLLPALWAFAVLACPCTVRALPGPCVEYSPGVFTCWGDHTQGIASGTDFNSPPAHTLVVNSLAVPITPSSGKGAIHFSNTSGGSVTIKSGTALESVIITTQGSNASGIKALGTGSPSSYTLLPGLGISVPGESSGAGGPVSVESRSTITTSGFQAHGIWAQNAIGTYDPAVVTALQDFSTSDVTISLASVGGAGDNIGGATAGDRGGLFTLAGNGTWDFDVDTLADTLEVGDSVITTIHYEVLLSSSSGTTRSEGSLAVLVTKVDDETFTRTPAVYFNDFRVYSEVDGATPLWPNLQGYVDNLLADMGIGGAGESVSIVNHGNITTSGASAHGILGRAEGGRGAGGVSGSFWNAWLIPEAGGRGSNGGAVNLVHEGNIHTFGPRAHGVVAESQGGAGGTGGHGSLWRPDGAQGGTGGTGGEITVTGSGAIHTHGVSATGILAQSTGGAGGAGGSADTTGKGGAGGFAGRGGSVDIHGDWAITTEGEHAHGIWGKSLGGSAGPGGSGGWLISQPGAGGEASDGGPVSITSGGAVITKGDYAYGLYAQSVGGAGGTGASSFGLLWSYGGDGGSAGSGGSVSVVQNAGGAVVTQGKGSHALVAQSIGGGGGMGSDSSSLIVSVGGPGGAGGAGGVVSVINRGYILTHGDDARGVFAQSIGGGGGSTGASYFGLISVGGMGDAASHGGSVTIENSGNIATKGAGADAVFAESIGGGGGTGTSNIGTISVGGLGTGGGHGGSVSVTQSGNIATEGKSSRGIYAHSVGGGGGAGMGAYGVVAVGGSGAGSGSGGAVSVTNDGDITTLGDFSEGILAQSVGGGGGTGVALSPDDFVSGFLVSIGGTGSGGGSGGTVTVDNTGHIHTAGAYAKGIMAQSVGAGGGKANLTISNILTVGGSGGAAGSGGAVSVTHSGTITTEGSGAHGIDAQSVGGGGGAGGHGFSMAVNIGGSGGSSGDGGDVEVVSSGIIATKGNSARGISAQSVGGSGGSNFTDDGALDWQNVSFDAGLLLSIGGGGSGSGRGGSVSVVNDGHIFTEGDKADGIYAQSVGGGGGTGSYIIGAVAVEVDLEVGSEGMGEGGDVMVVNHGDIFTRGDAARGIYAQSVGGGGGEGRFSLGVLSFSHDAFVGSQGGGHGGAVTITNSGVISTQGRQSQGIFAESVGGSGGVGTSVLTGSMGLQFGSAVSVGGVGGEGGDGGALSVDNSGMIFTKGGLSEGIFAQSVGGGGGRGGHSLAVSAVISLIDLYSLNQTISLGGAGGGGGHGGVVSVHNTGVIVTEGVDARGVFAQSVGGGGGHGGHSLTCSYSVNNSFNYEDGIGGTGGDGGDGNAVNVKSEGVVFTLGDRADAVFAQSVGGGGGAGGHSALIRMKTSIDLPSIPGADQIPTLDLEGTLSSSIGGSGGSGGTGGSVTVENYDLLTTEGNLSSGLFAQSVGGGGGAGGASFHVDSSVSLLSATIPSEFKDLIGLPSVSLSVNTSVGGTGGSGGSGGDISAANAGTIVTAGENAAGLFAQSVGGGGGDGGHSISFKNEESLLGATVNLAPAVEVKYLSSLGGAGGGGGTGGAVAATNTGLIHTAGNLSDGVFAQSVGGGGGTGGAGMMISREVNILDLNIAPEVNVEISSSIGGKGGTGGVGGGVSVMNDGWIETEGAGASGIFAQSVGGGGGAGGASIVAETAQSLLTSSPPAFDVKYKESIGGAAGAGALGGMVSVNGRGDILTRGDQAIGIFAQSVGGGGGAGGASIAGAIKQELLTATLASGEIEVAFAIGGTGGTGGDGGDVTVEGGRKISTLGDMSHAILAQSVGGGGGVGGAVMSTESGQKLLDAAPVELKVGYASTIGGAGAAGGDGGVVTVTGYTDIHTRGDMSMAIFAQSVGGGGGDGGSILKSSTKQTLLSPAAPSAGVEIAFNIGGTGGAGGDGGSVTADFAGGITTEGSLSHGVFAQSIGGGGGTGGAYVNLQHVQELLTNAPAKAQIEYTSILGGDGGSAGDGGSVTLTGTGGIHTYGALSHAVFAQSVGGGGGTGGGYSALSLTQGMLTLASNTAKMSYSSTVGGAGGAAGTGGAVVVEQSGFLFTRGDSATGIFAQSVGGGGGNGAEIITININQSLLTASAGEQSVFELSHDTKLGGDASGGGDGGAVSVRNTGGIATTGHAAKGLVAQSVGGGGGRAGAVVSAEVKTAYLDAVSTRDIKAVFAASIGGKGGPGGDGGVVDVVNEGAIVTIGRGASALVAQSVGGGGGLAEYQISMDMDIEGIPAQGMVNPDDLQVVFSDTQGTFGNGGAVTVENRGDILTEGVFSSGLVAQSVGGGGGLVEILNAQGRTTADFGESMQGVLHSSESGLFFAGSVGGNGSGGSVTVENSGNIMVLGDHAFGIFAQSAGGEGAGAVRLTSSGDILAPGAEASGILVQSAGGTGNGHIDVTITGGTVLGGTGQGAGVSIKGGASNTLINHGAIGSVEGLHGRALFGAEGNETIYNFGIIEGTIYLGAGVNTFRNEFGGLYISGPSVTLGDGNHMINAGVLSPGGVATYQTTVLTGDFTQTSTGQLEMQIHHDGRHDRLVVNGGNASLDGTLSVARDTGLGFQNGAVYTLLTAENIDGTFSVIDIPESKPMLQFVYNQTTDAIEVHAIVPSAVTVASNQSASAIARYIDTILPGATGDLSYVLGVFQNLSLWEFDQAFAGLSPAPFDNLTQLSFVGMGQYTQSLHQRMALARHSANTQIQAAQARPVFLAQAGSKDGPIPQMAASRSTERDNQPTLWVSGRRHWGHEKAQPETGFSRYDYRVRAGTVGLDFTFRGNWMLGVSVNKAQGNVDLEPGQGRGKMESLTGAIYGSFFTRNAYLEGSFSYGVNNYKNYRHLTIGPIQRTAYSRHKANVFAAHLGGGYFFNLGGLSLGPVASLRYVYLKESPFTEMGAQSLSLRVGGRNTKSLVSKAGLRCAYVFDTPIGRITPEFGASIIYDFGIDDRVITASFDGSPDHVFSIPGRKVEKFGAAVDAGLTHTTGFGLSTALKYRGEFRNRFQSHGIMGELRFEF